MSLISGSGGEAIQAIGIGGYCHTVSAPLSTSTRFAKNNPSAQVRIINVYSDQPIHINAGDDTVEASETSTFIPADISVNMPFKQTATHFAIYPSGDASGEATVKVTEAGLDG